jgi:hypothetical protein
MTSLSFFLGSSKPGNNIENGEFQGINGYFYNTRVYTSNAFKGSVSEIEYYFNSIVAPPSMLPNHLAMNMRPGNNTISAM